MHDIEKQVKFQKLSAGKLLDVFMSVQSPFIRAGYAVTKGVIGYTKSVLDRGGKDQKKLIKEFQNLKLDESINTIGEKMGGLEKPIMESIKSEKKERKKQERPFVDSMNSIKEAVDRQSVFIEKLFSNPDAIKNIESLMKESNSKAKDSSLDQGGKDSFNVFNSIDAKMTSIDDKISSLLSVTKESNVFLETENKISRDQLLEQSKQELLMIEAERERRRNTPKLALNRTAYNQPPKETGSGMLGSIFASVLSGEIIGKMLSKVSILKIFKSGFGIIPIVKLLSKGIGKGLALGVMAASGLGALMKSGFWKDTLEEAGGVAKGGGGLLGASGGGGIFKKSLKLVGKGIKGLFGGVLSAIFTAYEWGTELYEDFTTDRLMKGKKTGKDYLDMFTTSILALPASLLDTSILYIYNEINDTNIKSAPAVKKWLLPKVQEFNSLVAKHGRSLYDKLIDMTTNGMENVANLKDITPEKIKQVGTDFVKLVSGWNILPDFVKNFLGEKYNMAKEWLGNGATTTTDLTVGQSKNAVVKSAAEIMVSDARGRSMEYATMSAKNKAAGQAAGIFAADNSVTNNTTVVNPSPIFTLNPDMSYRYGLGY